MLSIHVQIDAPGLKGLFQGASPLPKGTKLLERIGIQLFELFYLYIPFLSLVKNQAHFQIKISLSSFLE